MSQLIEGGDPFSIPQTHGDNGYTSATPITYGERVWAIFGTGLVVCHDADGQRRWARLLQKPTSGWGHSASPRLIDDKLIVAIVDLDPLTGQTLWRRDSEAHCGTPAVAIIGETAGIITTAG